MIATLLPRLAGHGRVRIDWLGILLLVSGVVPILILPFAYALTFESSTLSEGDLERVRAAYEKVQAAAREAA